MIVFFKVSFGMFEEQGETNKKPSIGIGLFIHVYIYILIIYYIYIYNNAVLDTLGMIYSCVSQLVFTWRQRFHEAEQILTLAVALLQRRRPSDAVQSVI